MRVLSEACAAVVHVACHHQNGSFAQVSGVVVTPLSSHGNPSLPQVKDCQNMLKQTGGSCHSSHV